MRGTAAHSLLLLVVLAADAVAAARVLYVTHSAGYRHDSIPLSAQVLGRIAAETGVLEVLATEDLSYITAARLREFDAVFFFTSGELRLSESQKNDLLSFVREGKGFGGVHSATDTFYGWPEYGELIGAWFDGHPWTHEVSIDVEDPDHPATRDLGASFRIYDEIYQFRDFSRDRVRVLLTLDTRSVDLRATGVNRTDSDFALAWCRPYGRGRTFYTALGHGEGTWRDPRFQSLMRGALLWLTGQAEGDGAPRTASTSPAPSVSRVRRPAGSAPPLAPGSLFVIEGAALSSGSSRQAASFPYPVRLAGTSVHAGGAAVPLASVSPETIVAQLPFDLPLGEQRLEVWSGGRTVLTPPVRIEATAPEVLAVLRDRDALILYATGLGPVRPAVASGAAAPGTPPSETAARPEVTINDIPLEVFFSGLAPGFAGLYQVNARLPEGLPAGVHRIFIRAGGKQSETVSWQP